LPHSGARERRGEAACVPRDVERRLRIKAIGVIRFARVPEAQSDKSTRHVPGDADEPVFGVCATHDPVEWSVATSGPPTMTRAFSPCPRHRGVKWSET
jgi:hypothetical protein